MDWSDEDKRKAEVFLKPFGEFLYGNTNTITWGYENDDGERGGEDSRKGEDRLTLLDEEGVTREDVKDEDWERCMRVADVVWGAQQKAQEAMR